MALIHIFVSTKFSLLEKPGCWTRRHLGLNFQEYQTVCVGESVSLRRGTHFVPYDAMQWRLFLFFSWMTFWSQQNCWSLVTWRKKSKPQVYMFFFLTYRSVESESEIWSIKALRKKVCFSSFRSRLRCVICTVQYMSVVVLPQFSGKPHFFG